MNLYLDVDGVLLNKYGLAKNLEQFLEFCLNHFNCYFLTSHCPGTTEHLLNYLKPYTTDKEYSLLSKVKPTHFKLFKSEALKGDFIWLDDNPGFYEKRILRKNNQLERLIIINTNQDPCALTSLITLLSSLLNKRNYYGK